jgi:hypothetical protein
VLGFFHLAGPHLDLGPVHLQDPEVVLGAPPEPLQQVRLVVAARRPPVAGQIRGGGQLGAVEALVEVAGMDKISGEVHGSSAFQESWGCHPLDTSNTLTSTGPCVTRCSPRRTTSALPRRLPPGRGVSNTRRLSRR